MTIKEIIEQLEIDEYTFFRVLRFLDDKCPHQCGIDETMIPRDAGYCIDSCTRCWLETLENIKQQFE